MKQLFFWPSGVLPNSPLRQTGGEGKGEGVLLGYRGLSRAVA
jgi:hypothetical protein